MDACVRPLNPRAPRPGPYLLRSAKRHRRVHACGVATNTDARSEAAAQFVNHGIAARLVKPSHPANVPVEMALLDEVRQRRLLQQGSVTIADPFRGGQCSDKAARDDDVTDAQAAKEDVGERAHIITLASPARLCRAGRGGPEYRYSLS